MRKLIHLLVMPEMRFNAAVGREGFVFEFVVVDKLCLVDEQPREGERVGRAGAVLRYDNGDGAVVERNDVFVVVWLGDRLGKGFRWFPSDNIVNPVDESPAFPRGKQSGQGVRKAVLEGRHDDAAGTPCHA